MLVGPWLVVEVHSLQLSSSRGLVVDSMSMLGAVRVMLGYSLDLVWL